MLDNFRNNVVHIKVKFHNFGKRLSNIVKMTISRKNKSLFQKK